MVVPIRLANSTVRGEFTGGVWLEVTSLILIPFYCWTPADLLRVLAVRCCDDVRGCDGTGRDPSRTRHRLRAGRSSHTGATTSRAALRRAAPAPRPRVRSHQ